MNAGRLHVCWDVLSYDQPQQCLPQLEYYSSMPYTDDTASFNGKETLVSYLLVSGA
jgi:hypothetical protein